MPSSGALLIENFTSTAKNKKICQQLPKTKKYINKTEFSVNSPFFKNFMIFSKRTYQQDLSFRCVTRDSTSKEKYFYLKKVFLYKLHQKANKAFCWIATEISLTELVSAHNFVVWQWNLVSNILGFLLDRFFQFSRQIASRFVSKIEKICLVKFPKSSQPVSLSNNRISCRKQSWCGSIEQRVLQITIFYVKFLSGMFLAFIWYTYCLCR